MNLTEDELLADCSTYKRNYQTKRSVTIHRKNFCLYISLYDNSKCLASIERAISGVDRSCQSWLELLNEFLNGGNIDWLEGSG